MSLNTNLIAYWKLDETSGTRNDSVGSNHLTDNNTVTSAAGIISNAAEFLAANSEFLSIADNTDLSTGDIDFTISFWVYFNATTPAALVGKWETSANREYAVYLESNVINFSVSTSGVSISGTVTAAALGLPSTGTWYFVVAWHDSINNTLNIQADNATPESTAYSSGVVERAAAFKIGTLYDSPGVYDFSGRIDEVGFWKRVLTTDERSALYNSGNGLAYPFPVSLSPSFRINKLRPGFFKPGLAR